jgi:hypothetical protein
MKPIDPEKIEIVMRAECPECAGGTILPPIGELCAMCAGRQVLTWGVPMRDFMAQVFAGLEIIRKEREGGT